MVQRQPHGAVETIDALLRKAIALDVSDVHVDPMDDCLLVRVRRDGELQDLERLPIGEAASMVARLKVLAGLLTYRIDIPQEGAFSWSNGETPGSNAVDLRVATFPTVRGERVAIRIFRDRDALLSIDELGFTVDQIDRLKAAVASTAGLICMTGPAGSGKTTTLYALLDYMSRAYPGRSLITLEDPVERRIDRVTQIEIHPHGELDYARCMRSLLRQDPQVIMLGEVRDARTAQVAVEAALTGHLILTTMHAGDAAEVVVRLLDMGIAPYQLVSALTWVVSSRLLRLRCQGCGGAGCRTCLESGYDGRTACGDVVEISERLRPMILRSAPVSQLRTETRSPNHQLIESARALVRQGLTDDAELARVLGVCSQDGGSDT